MYTKELTEAISLFEKDVSSFCSIPGESLISYFNAMQNADQMSEWHREGDVLTHTLMVRESLFEVLEEYDRPFDPADIDHQALILSAWFHDFGKPSVMEWSERKQRNIFYNHEMESASIWRTIALNNKVDPILIEKTRALIRHHGDPISYTRQKAVQNTFQRLALKAPPRLLYLLELADMFGRICDDLPFVLDHLEQFKNKCIEYDVFDIDRFKEIQFITLSDFATETTPSLLLPVAIPGTGKSYLRNQLKCFFISPDEIRLELFPDQEYQRSQNEAVFGTAKRRLREACEKKEQMIYFDAQNLTHKDRKGFTELAKKYSYQQVAFWFATPLGVILEQNRSRKKYVDEGYVSLRWSHMEFPTEVDKVVLVGMNICNP